MEIEAIISDMDGTLVQFENSDYKSSWDAIGNQLTGWRKDQWFLNLEVYYKEKDKLSEWAESDAMLLKGINAKEILQGLRPIPYSNGAKEFFNNGHGKLSGILSGGVSLVADELKDELNMDFALSCKLKIENDYFTGEVEVLDMWKKHEILEEYLIKNYNIKMENVCYIGDHENDLEVFKRSGLAIAFDPKIPEVIDLTKHTIYDFMDLEKILKEY